MENPQLKIIGRVHGDIVHRTDAPKNYSESEHKGVLEIFPDYVEGIEDIAVGQTIVVLFWFPFSCSLPRRTWRTSWYGEWRHS